MTIFREKSKTKHRKSQLKILATVNHDDDDDFVDMYLDYYDDTTVMENLNSIIEQYNHEI